MGKRVILAIFIIEAFTLSIAELCGFTTSAGAGDQEITATQQKVKVTYQLTDVVVKDLGGKFVRGLRPDDFSLEINGKPVDIKSVDEIHSVSSDDARVTKYIEWFENEEKQSAEPPPLPTRPRFVIMVFDRFNMGMAGAKASIDSAKNIVEQSLLPYDRVAVFLYNGSLRTLTGPTTDRERIFAAIEEANIVSQNDHYRPSSEEIFPPKTRAEVWPLKNRLMQKSFEFENYMKSMRALAKSLEALPGRKTYLLFSEGPNLYNPLSPDKIAGKVDTSDPDSMEILSAGSSLSPTLVAKELSELARYISSTNSSVYTIRRGPIQPEWMLNMDLDTEDITKRDFTTVIQQVSADMLSDRLDVLRTAAHLTNGKFLDAGMSDEKLIENIREEVGNYYLLGFVPPKGKEGAYHKIEVKTKDSSYKVAHRDGFFEPKSFAKMNAEERAIHLEEGFLAPGARNELGLDAHGYTVPFSSRQQVLLAFKIDSNRVGKSESGGCELEMVINVEDSKGDIRYRSHKVFKNQSENLPGELWLFKNIPLADDGCTVFLAVRDNAGGRRATWSYPFKGYSGTQDSRPRVMSIMLSPDLKGDMSKWESEEIADGIKVNEPIPVLNFKVQGKPLVDFEVRQGEEIFIMLAVGNLPQDFDLSNMKLFISYILDAREEEGYSLLVLDEEYAYSTGQRMLMITALVPLGLAQRPSGQLSITLKGLLGNNELTATMPYIVSDFSTSKAAELSEA